MLYPEVGDEVCIKAFVAGALGEAIQQRKVKFIVNSDNDNYDHSYQGLTDGFGEASYCFARGSVG